jgi:hypothetical protein
MQLDTASIGEIENDIVSYFGNRYRTDPVQLTPATAANISTHCAGPLQLVLFGGTL